MAMTCYHDDDEDGTRKKKKKKKRETRQGKARPQVARQANSVGSFCPCHKPDAVLRRARNEIMTSYAVARPGGGAVLFSRLCWKDGREGGREGRGERACMCGCG